ncbi:MAG: histidinol dehydrogenase [Paracoccaceae bacterium]|nr:histidinol dehydrogenase [Paracoccaceae bacterium]
MQILNSQDSNFASSLEKLINQPRVNNEDVRGAVAKIIERVISKKDKALVEFTKKFDNVVLRSEDIMFSDLEILQYCADVPDEHKKALDLAASRIKEFHQKQLPSDKYWTDKTGIEMGWKWRPIEYVGLYVPGGTASYPSSVLMNAIPARIAGAKEIVMVSPVPSGKINPLVIYAARTSGINKIYKIGGAHAIAALAFGTETINPVDKIVGPGNAFVAEAKRQVFGRVGIDMVAGPSEVVIIADNNNNPDWISADLLSQAEHDTNAQAVLITTSKEFALKVRKSLKSQITKITRTEIASKSIKRNGAIVIVDDLDVAVNLSNRFAPEHLQLCVKDPDTLIKSIKNAGSIFLGAWNPEALGDYVIGMTHVLPTEKSVRYASGLSVLDFMKRSFISKVTATSFKAVGKTASTLANAEGLGAHQLSVDLRCLESKSNDQDG